jgi:hypothetical protein
MARITKKQQPATDINMITVADAVTQLRTTEQALRLALIDIRPDDFDTVKALPMLDFEAVTKKLLEQQQPQLSPSADVVGGVGGNPETTTQQALEPTTEQPQKAPIVPSIGQQQIANTQSPIPNSGLSLVEMVARQSQEEISAIDGLLQVRNALVFNAMAARDSELSEGVNQRWQSRKGEYLGVIQDLASLAQEPVQITPDTTDINAEIDSILGKLKTA